MVIIPASRFRRALAILVDKFILSVPVLIAQYSSPSRQYLTLDLDLIQLLIPDFRSLAIGYLCSIPYFALFESSKYMATPGKELLGLYVSTTKGKKLSFGKALVRRLFYLLPSLPLTIVIIAGEGHKYLPGDTIKLIVLLAVILYPVTILMDLIWSMPVFFTKKRQGVYELLTHTMVCKKSG